MVEDGNPDAVPQLIRLLVNPSGVVPLNKIEFVVSSEGKRCACYIQASGKLACE